MPDADHAPPTDRPPRTRPNYAAASPLRLDVEFRVLPEIHTYLELVFEQEEGPDRGRARARAWLNSGHASIELKLMIQVYLAATSDRLPVYRKPGALRGFFLNPLGLTALAISSALFILGVILLLGWVAGL